MIFSWGVWNTAHIAEHGIEPEEAEYVVRRAKRPYPMDIGDDKFLVIGSTAAGRTLHVIFTIKDINDVEVGSVSLLDVPDDLIQVEVNFVIHAMSASDKMKRHDRRRRKP